MTVVTALEEARSWLTGVCGGLKFKAPHDEQTTADYPYREKEPAVYVFDESSDRELPAWLPASAPSVCVQLIKGEDRLAERLSAFHLQLTFVAWNPGLHAPDVFTPTDTDHTLYHRGTGSGFGMRGDCWRDVWNFVDVARGALAQTDGIAGMRIAHEEGIRFGPVLEDGAPVNAGPYALAWLTFTLNAGLNKPLQNEG